MQRVFLAWHDYDNEGCDDYKLLGVFSTRALADTAIGSRREKPGFVDHPDGFVIDEYVVDEDKAWSEGFIKVRDA